MVITNLVIIGSTTFEGSQIGFDTKPSKGSKLQDNCDSPEDRFTFGVTR